MAAATAVSVFRALTKACEEIRNTDPQSLRNMEVGDEWRQGDLRIIRLPDDFGAKFKAELEPTQAVNQLAPGTTQGSRHCIIPGPHMQFYRLKEATPLDGPVLHTAQPFEVAHPEHGDCIDCPPGWYAFPGQRAYGEELRRVQD